MPIKFNLYGFEAFLLFVALLIIFLSLFVLKGTWVYLLILSAILLFWAGKRLKKKSDIQDKKEEISLQESIIISRLKQIHYKFAPSGTPPTKKSFSNKDVSILNEIYKIIKENEKTN